MFIMFSKLLVVTELIECQGNIISIFKSIGIAVEYPGFSPGGCTNSQSGCANLFFGHKLHEN